MRANSRCPFTPDCLCRPLIPPRRVAAPFVRRHIRTAWELVADCGIIAKWFEGAGSADCSICLSGDYRGGAARGAYSLRRGQLFRIAPPISWPEGQGHVDFRGLFPNHPRDPSGSTGRGASLGDEPIQGARSH